MTPNKSYFLIVSGNRCGSTWLEFMLNMLPDVSLEYEVQWTDQYLSDLHISMKQEGFDVQRMFDLISAESCVVGSKLVFPPHLSVLTDEAAEFNRIIGNNISIIHIGRPYIESYLSKLRNGGHLRNKLGGEPPVESKRWLVDEYKETVLTDNTKINLVLDEVERDFQCRLQNDQFNLSLNNGIRPYFYTEYCNIADNFSHIVSIIGSHADDNQIKEILAAPPTQKLPYINYKSCIQNYGELMRLSDCYEKKRLASIKNQSKFTY